MIPLLLMAATQTLPPAAPAAPAPVANQAEPPHDWSALPDLTLPPATPNMVRFVRDEVQAGRCPRPKASEAGQMVIVVPLALRFGSEGVAQSVVPLAIGCPTIEQFSAGAAQRMVRQLSHRTLLATDRWYRTAITYTWPG